MIKVTIILISTGILQQKLCSPPQKWVTYNIGSYMLKYLANCQEHQKYLQFVPTDSVYTKNNREAYKVHFKLLMLHYLPSKYLCFPPFCPDRPPNTSWDNLLSPLSSSCIAITIQQLNTSLILPGINHFIFLKLMKIFYC